MRQKKQRLFYIIIFQKRKKYFYINFISLSLYVQVKISYIYDITSNEDPARRFGT